MTNVVTNPLTGKNVTGGGPHMAHGLALENLPASVLYDVFLDAVAVLTGQYLQQEREASDPAVAASWWTKALDLRATSRLIDPDDRAGLVEHTRRWRREATDLGDTVRLRNGAGPDPVREAGQPLGVGSDEFGE
jgi:hypothetical protein